MQKRFLFTPALVIIFILFFTVFGERGLLRISHLHRDRDEMQKRVQELKDENDKLKREIAALQTDRRYLESIARRDFGLVRSNEVIYQFHTADKAAPPQGEKKAEPGGDQNATAKAGAKAATGAQKR
jgi:cell division protein FtsB